jgi:hypothetical protein
MDNVESMIESPGDKDVPLSQVFPAAAFDELATAMRRIGWDGVDEIVALWATDYSARPLVTGFLKDKDLGAKRFMSMPDRFTNTVNVVSTTGEAACRPSVVNNYVGDLGSFSAWWQSWKSFMFEQPLMVAGKKGPVERIPYMMLSK